MRVFCSSRLYVFGKPASRSRIFEIRWLFSANMDDGSASVFCFTPLRVPVSKLAPLAACPPSHAPLSESVCSAPPLPQGPCPVCPRLEQEFEASRQAVYWKDMHGRALQREAQLKVENERLQAPLRLCEQQLVGRKTETSAATAPAASDASYADSPPRQPRGQQRGQPSPKLRDYSHLPDVVEDKVLPSVRCCCSRCGPASVGLPRSVFPLADGTCLAASYLDVSGLSPGLRDFRAWFAARPLVSGGLPADRFHPAAIDLDLPDRPRHLAWH